MIFKEIVQKQTKYLFLAFSQYSHRICKLFFVIHRVFTQQVYPLTGLVGQYLPLASIAMCGYNSSKYLINACWYSTVLLGIPYECTNKRKSVSAWIVVFRFSWAPDMLGLVSCSCDVLNQHHQARERSVGGAFENRFLICVMCVCVCSNLPFRIQLFPV